MSLEEIGALFGDDDGNVSDNAAAASAVESAVDNKPPVGPGSTGSAAAKGETRSEELENTHEK